MIAKFFWLAVILAGVWTVFRVIEKRNAKLRPPESGNTPQTGAQANAKNNERDSAEDDALELRECDECGAFVTAAGCSRAACSVRG
jgi:hypothetical protein